MEEYYITEISPSDLRGNAQVDALLAAEGIRRDSHLDYTCGMYDEEGDLIATGSCFGNTLRCMAVKGSHRGEGLMNQIVTHLNDIQIRRGNTRLFLYTKCDSAAFFSGLGFYKIAEIKDQIVFMENRRGGFASYLERLKKETADAPAATALGGPVDPSRTASIVMNANPFTLGHLSLVETAAAENDLLHLFMVSEDQSLIPFSIRKRLILEGTSHLKNIVYHESGPYMISTATFPSYFQKDSAAVYKSHAMLDLAIFTQIAKSLGIGCRYVGEERNSQVTAVYNKIMSRHLPEQGIRCRILPRKEYQGTAISASDVRRVIQTGHIDKLAGVVPASTLRYFRSPEAEPIIRRIRSAGNVVHH